MKVEYFGKVKGRGKVKSYKGYPKFFVVLDIDKIGEKKSMISLDDFYNDPISNISKEDIISFEYNSNYINNEWLNITSTNVKIVDDSGSKAWQKQREEFIRQKKKEETKLREQQRKEREEEKNQRKLERRMLYKKYQMWYLQEYNSKTSGANVLLMYDVLQKIKNHYSFIGHRGKKAILNDGSWEAPEGLYADVFHGLNSKITDKALNELTDKKFAIIKTYDVIFRDSRSGLEIPGKKAGINITKKGQEFIIKFKKIINKEDNSK